jgi:hypothetical protein
MIVALILIACFLCTKEGEQIVGNFDSKRSSPILLFFGRDTTDASNNLTLELTPLSKVWITWEEEEE